MNTDDRLSPALPLARSRLLDPHELNDQVLGAALSAASGKGTDFADLYFETTTRETWRLENQRVTSGGYSVSQGVGIRTVAGDRTAFAYSSNLSPIALETTARAAREMQSAGLDARNKGGKPVFRIPPAGHALYTSEDIVQARQAADKVTLIEELDRRARAADPRIVRVMAQLRLTQSIILVTASDGTLEADVRPLLRVDLMVIAEQNRKISRGSAGAGGRYGLDGLTEDRLARLIERATKTALVNLDARPAPAGVMPVVLGRGFPGVLLHEAVGHGLEGDAHRTHSSVFADRMGSAIAAAGVTVVDDGALPGMAGSLNIDDEGSRTERTVLIDKGRLTGLMQDKLNARLMNQSSTGNARRSSYSQVPMPRMTNTFLEAGEHDPQEIIASVDKGIYAVEFGGGTVDITSGRFNFSSTQAYLIEKGRITAPISGATLIGVGHEALQHISLIGNDLSLDDGEAICGKNGQNVVVGVGQPTIRVDEMVVGGAG